MARILGLIIAKAEEKTGGSEVGTVSSVQRLRRSFRGLSEVRLTVLSKRIKAIFMAGNMWQHMATIEYICMI